MRTIVLLFFLSIYLSAMADYQAIVNLPEELPLVSDKLKNLPEHIFISSYTSESDCLVDEDELVYLFSLKKNKSWKRSHIVDGFSYLAKKRKFKKITLTLTLKESGYNAYFKLEGVWSFARVKLHGALFEKQEHQQFYGFFPGDPFIEERHKEFLDRMKQELHDKGYFGAILRDRCIYDAIRKQVTVHITLEKGPAYVVDKVDVDCKDNIHADEVIKKIERVLVQSLRNKRYRTDSLFRATKQSKQLLDTYGYPEAQVQLNHWVNDKKKVLTLQFHIVCGEKRRLIFEGNTFFTKEKLQETFVAFESSLSFIPTMLLEEELVELYQEYGFWDVSIHTQEKDGCNIFTINEGARSKIIACEFEGVHHVDKTVLQTIVRPLFFIHSYRKEKEQEILEKLIAYYKSQGFWDMCIVDTAHTFFKKEGRKLCLVIDEGEQKYIEKSFVEYYPTLSKDLIFLFSDKSKLKPFDQAIIHEQRMWLQKYFLKMGYASISLAYRLDHVKDRYTLIWSVDLKKMLTFGKTIVVGSTGIPFARLQKTFLYQEGLPWKQEKLAHTRELLRKADMFEFLSLYPDYKSVRDQERDIIFVAQEQLRNELRLRGGLQQMSKNFAFKEGSTYKIGWTWLIRNPFKKLDQILFDVDITRFEKNVALAYSIPCLFGPETSLLVKGYANKYSQPISRGSNKRLYTIIQNGFLAHYMHNKEHVHSGLAIGLEWMETKHISMELAKAIHFEPELVHKRIPFIFIEPSLYFDYVDDKLQPTKGYYGILSLKGMFPLKASSYLIKGIFEQAFFIPIWHCTLAVRVRFGHIFKKIFKNIMPTERFYLGGANSIRGYEPDTCPPIGSFEDEQSIKWVPQGGKSMVNMNFELRIPIIYQLSGVLFQDFGVLSGSHEQQVSQKGKTLAATGFGWRYATPIGSLRFDIGWKWNKRFENDSRYAWALTLGHAF